MITRFALLAASAALALGCAAPRLPAAVDPAAAAREADAHSAAMGQAAASRMEYRISAADLVSVTVYDVEGLDRKARVDGRGMIFLPLVGAVKVGGKTVAEAQRLIAQKLSAYVIKPQVSLFIEEYGNNLFFVLGEVQKPGSYPIPADSRMTVMEAISTAGGFTPVAAQDRTRVLRSVGGESLEYVVDVRGIVRDGAKEKDMILEPNDVVYVPQSLF